MWRAVLTFCRPDGLTRPNAPEVAALRGASRADVGRGWLRGSDERMMRAHRPVLDGMRADRGLMSSADGTAVVRLR